MFNKLKILYLVNIPSPYRVTYFNELGKLCELTVLFERKSSDEREETWHDYDFKNFKGIFLEGIKYKKNQAISIAFAKYINKKDYDHIIVGGYATPTGALLINYLKIRQIPFILNIDGGMISEKESKLRESLKKYFISSASAWLSTGDVGSKYLIHYGANKENIFTYPFTTLKEVDILKQVLSKDEKIKLRRKLGLKNTRIVLAVGQFVHRKGFDLLINASLQLPTDTSIYFVGGIPTEEYLELKKQLKLNNIHFLGFKSKDEILNYYRAADVFVLPTREDIWGLVINEAMANGLPVVTTNRCVAGLELVDNYDNGFIVPVENVNELALRINEVISNDELMSDMAERSLRKAKNYTVENMALETHKILNFIKKGNLNVE
ncbi:MULTISPECIES: glycosyltransferase family 4 protein [unclassified Exiguobacterium]|uniref:glycosyltransferase family 4 protein n=1 Tax=unclassified Exiguobacterium TaxID=2644629 RepID=UPI001BE50FEF|nr:MULTISPECIES: glycosyltransferase family 4 protein [unclassified Exiguobacterium]